VREDHTEGVLHLVYLGVVPEQEVNRPVNVVAADSPAVEVVVAEGVLPLLQDAEIPAASGGPTYRFVAHDDFASAWFWDFDPATQSETFGGLWVHRGGTGRNRTTWLDYYVVSCRTFEDDDDWWSWECDTLADGWGTIPNNHLSGTAKSGLSLNTNTAEIPGFNHFGGAGGPISVQWKKSGWYAESFSGAHRWAFGPFEYRSNGTRDWSDATATGFVVSVDLSEFASGSMGQARGATIEFYRPNRN
jgi:hypothetical protein